ncbi:MAG: hypothetical protein JWN16_802 [Alphaproteobacteria bacterium]|nr:hypothetical protein [Alphaproteobacteria bacterium]
MRSQLLAARATLVLLVLAVLTAAVAIGGVRTGKFSYAIGMDLMWPATALGLAALALALWWLKGAIAHNVGTGKRLGMTALIGACAFLYPPVGALVDGWRYPAIHDASSDPDDPPQFVALARLRTPGMNPPAFDGQQKIHWQGEDVTISYALHTWKNGLLTKHHTKLMPNSQNPQGAVFWHCFEAVKKMGWTIIDYSEKDGRIEATAATPWFGQLSDIAIRVRPSGYLGARYDIRAQSRVGATDNGFNMELVRVFKAKADS